MDLSLIIVTYNSREAIGKCLSSIDPELLDGAIIVDNGSTDDTVAIAQKFGVKIIHMGGNKGFARAANAGAKAAGKRFLCFLNPDCEPAPELFQSGVEALRGHPGRCAVPTLLEGEGRPLVGRQEGYTRLKLMGDIICTNYGNNFLCRSLINAPRCDDPGWWWPHGACLFIARDWFLKIGGFDSRFFMYMEDVDFGRRLTAAGGEVFELDQMLIHGQGHSSKISRKRRLLLLNYGRIRYASVHHGLVFAVMLALFTMPALLFRAVKG